MRGVEGEGGRRGRLLGLEGWSWKAEASVPVGSSGIASLWLGGGG